MSAMIVSLTRWRSRVRVSTGAPFLFQTHAAMMRPMHIGEKMGFSFRLFAVVPAEAHDRGS